MNKESCYRSLRSNFDDAKLSQAKHLTEPLSKTLSEALSKDQANHQLSWGDRSLMSASLLKLFKFEFEFKFKLFRLPRWSMVLFLATASLCGAIGLPNPAAALTFSMMDNLEAPGGGFFGDPIGPGFTIERNQYESDTNVFFFLESVNQIFAVPIAVDADQPGVNYNSGNLSIGAIPAGIMIDSYYFSYDPETDGIGISRSTTASITFDKPIGGLIFQDTFLSASDTLDPSNLNFAQANVTYPPDGIVNPGINDMNIGVDGGSAGITWTGRTLNFDVSAGSNGVDNVRVLLVPFEFSPSMGLVALGLGAAGWYVAKKRVARLRKIS